MAKKSMIARDVKRAKQVDRFATKRKELKRLIKDPNLDYDERILAQVKLQRLPRNASPMRYTRRCVSCGRPRGVYRKFGLCRLCLRKELMFGNVPGGRKASW